MDGKVYVCVTACYRDELQYQTHVSLSRSDGQETTMCNRHSPLRSNPQTNSKKVKVIMTATLIPVKLMTAHLCIAMSDITKYQREFTSPI